MLEMLQKVFQSASRIASHTTRAAPPQAQHGVGSVSEIDGHLQIFGPSVQERED